MSHRTKEILKKELHERKEARECEAWCLLGDFNNIKVEEEKNGRRLGKMEEVKSQNSIHL